MKSLCPAFFGSSANRIRAAFLVSFVLLLSAIAFVGESFADDWPPQFGRVRNLTEINSEYHDGWPCLSVDGLSLYFGSTRGGNWDLYVATRDPAETLFGPPRPLDTLNSHNNDGAPSISADQLTIYFYRSYSPSYVYADIWAATRESVDSDFGPPFEMTALNYSSHWNVDPEISSNGLELFLRKGTGGLYRSVREDLSEPFSSTVRLAGTKSYSRSPSLTADGKILAYGVEIRGNSNDGLWIARRDLGLPGEEFRDDARISGFSDVAEVEISPDGNYILFHDTRAGGLGGIDIWLAERVEPTPTPTPTPEVHLAGTLSGGLVTPGHGDTGTDFSWSVDYTSPADEDPGSALVLVDGIPYEMEKTTEGGLTDTYGFGPMQLPEGSHSYWFEFTDSGGWGRFPESPGGRLFGPVVSDGNLPVIAIDLDASTDGIEENVTRTRDRTYEGAVRLLSFPDGEDGGYNRYSLKLEGLPCVLCGASTTPGDHPLDALEGVDASNPGQCRIGRVLLTTVDVTQEAPADVFRFQYCVSDDMELDFLADSADYGIGALGVTYLLQDGEVIHNSAFVHARDPEPLDVLLTAWIEPSEPGTLEDLLCVTEIDNLGGYENLTTSYRWFRNGNELVDPLEVDGEIHPVTGPVLSHHYTSRYDELYCIAEVTDGWDAVSATTATVTILNSPPTAPVVEIRPPEPMPGEDLGINILVYSTDPDGDEVAYRIDWHESEDGGETWIEKIELRNLAFISGLYLQEGDLWRVEVTPYEVAVGKMKSAAVIEGETGWDQVYVGRNSDPVVRIERPGAGNVVAAPAVSIAWQAEDADGDPVRVDLYYDTDGVKGGSVLIASGLPASGTFRWTPPGAMKVSPGADLSGNGTIDGADLFAIASRWLVEPPGPRYRIFARAYDSKLAVGDAMSDGEVIAAEGIYASPALLVEVKGAWHEPAP